MWLLCVGQDSVFLVPTIFGDPQRGLTPEYLIVTNIKDMAPVCGPGLCLLGPDDLW